MNIPYLSGNLPPADLPLGRFLPPIPKGMAHAWCQAHLKPGDWVLEPFGFNPLMVTEIASAGHPVLVCVNNPINAFLLDMLSSAPSADDLTAALQDLAIASKGDERMEPYIRGLYHINCPNCKHQTEAKTFLWKKDASQPFAAQVNCTFCGAQDELPLTDDVLESQSPLPPKELHQARALNRITERDDELRSQVANILNFYPARPLIILQTIINKLDTLEQSPRRRELLIALILSAADRGNTLWAHPSPRNRPRQMVVPAVYQERNLWMVMEEAIAAWHFLESPVSLTDWQGIPEQPKGIYKFHGRVRELAPPPPKDFFSAVIAAIPRPNQAFWSLSALWTGWIWGQEAVAPIRQVLSRQRYDWNWHCHALMGVFDAIYTLQGSELKIWGLLPEIEPMLLLAALLAADASGLQLETFAQSQDDQLAQCSWVPAPEPPVRPLPEQTLEIARESIMDYLVKKGEPATYQQIHTAVIAGLAHKNKLAIDIFLQNMNQAASETQKWIETLLQQPGFLHRISGSKASLETGVWWLANPSEVKLSQIDFLEEHIYGYLLTTPAATAEKVKTIAQKALPGIFTPEDEEVLNCLSSYAHLEDPQKHRWTLRENEKLAARQIDKQTIFDSLKLLAKRLDYRVSGQDPLYWHEDQDSHPKFRFYILTTAIISPILTAEHPPAQTSIIVLPGSRANLLAYKKQRDPNLKERLDRDYLVVKFRLVRDLEVNPLLSRDLFKDLIHADPPEYRASQLALL